MIAMLKRRVKLPRARWRKAKKTRWETGGDDVYEEYSPDDKDKE
jgi:hypothetical protein